MRLPNVGSVPNRGMASALLLAVSAAAIPLLAPPAAHALTGCVPKPVPIPIYDPVASCGVTLADGSEWEIRTTMGAFGNGTVNGVNLTTQTWWNNPARSEEFARLVGIGLGTPNEVSPFFPSGPYFAHSFTTIPSLVSFDLCYTIGLSVGDELSVGCDRASQALDVDEKWAYATPVPSASVPGPLPGLGAAAAFGFSRKLRKRIKSRKPPVASALD